MLAARRRSDVGARPGSRGRPRFARAARYRTAASSERSQPDPLPRADVLIMGHILHDWDLERKRYLIAKAHEALPAGGALIIYETLIDDARRENAVGLLMSLNMLIETRGGFDYTGADCIGWLQAAGFRDCRTVHLAGAESMVIGLK